MRNLFEKAFTNQANRLSQYNDISDEELNIIKSEDIIVQIKNELQILFVYLEILGLFDIKKDNISFLNSRILILSFFLFLCWIKT